MKFVFILVGVFTLASTYFKPSFYWESRKARRARALFGDVGAAGIYYVIGAAALIFGILNVLNSIPMN